jgi:hypothetical protein
LANKNLDGQQELRKKLYERNVLPKLPGSPHTKDSLLDQKANKYSRDKFAVAQLPLEGDNPDSSLVLSRPHVAGPFYKPYINENRSGIIKQYESLPVDPKQKDDNGYRHKLAAELKLYEKTQHEQKIRLQDSLKTSLSHQLELKNYQKDNAFRMTKREKDINRTGLHVKFSESKI